MSSYLLKRQSQITTTSTSLTSKVQQLQLKLQALKKQIRQKQQIIKSYQNKIQQQQQVIQEKQFIIQEKDLTLQHILKENEQLHEKIFQLNQSSIKHQKEIKQTIKSQIGTIKQEFNFMLKQNQIKNQIILDSKVKEFKRRQNQLQEIIKDLSEKASSNNGSFYYEESHSNIIKSKKVPNSYAYNSRDSRDSRNMDSDFYNRDQSEPERAANVNLVNSKESIRSSQAKQSKNYEYSKFGRQKQVHRQQQLSSILSANLKSDNGKYSSSNLLNYAKQPHLSSTLQKKYQYVPPTKYQKAPYSYDTKAENSSNTNTYNRTQYKQTQKQPEQSKYSSSISKQNSQAKLQEILSRTRKDQKYQIEIKAKSKIYDTTNINSNQEDKRKQQKLKQINSLKMKVNMLKSQLKQQISFCQEK